MKLATTTGALQSELIIFAALIEQPPRGYLGGKSEHEGAFEGLSNDYESITDSLILLAGFESRHRFAICNRSGRRNREGFAQFLAPIRVE